MADTKVFRIPVSFTMMGFAEIEATSIEEAVKIFDDTMDDLPLPEEPIYVDGSYHRETAFDGATEKENLDYYMMYSSYKY